MGVEDRRDEGVVERLTRERDEARSGRDEACSVLEQTAEFVDRIAFTISRSEGGAPSYATNPEKVEWLKQHFHAGSASFFDVPEAELTVIVVPTHLGKTIAQKIQEAADAHRKPKRDSEAVLDRRGNRNSPAELPDQGEAGDSAAA